MRSRLKTTLAALALVFVLAAGSAQAATPIMDYYSYIYNNNSYLEAEAYTSFEGCDGEWWECQLNEIGAEMTVYENNVQIWSDIDRGTNGRSYAVVNTLNSIAVDYSNSYHSTAYHWAEGSYFSWGISTYDSM